MKNICFIFMATCLLSSSTVAQYGNIWVFGNYAGLDFNSGQPAPFKSAITTWEGSATICNKKGELLFYSDGTTIWDRKHNKMPNGTDLAPFGTNSTSQACVIVPMPANPRQFFIFSLTPYEAGPNKGRLYYSMVDLDLNGGLGDVVPGRKALLLDSGLTEKMTAIPGQHCDIWLLTCTQKARFKSWKISGAHIDATPVLSEVGLGSYSMVFGCITSSSDYKKIASTQAINGGSAIGGAATLFDFDNKTGIASNPLSLFPESTQGGYGICFSRDNSKLYVSVNNTIEMLQLYQFDLSSKDPTTIINSQTAVAKSSYTHVKLAPDGKIYFAAPLNSGNTMSCINYPDKAGVACGYNVKAIQLLPNTAMDFGLPAEVAVAPSDTAVSTSQTLNAPCWQTAYTFSADPSGWDYTWDDGSSQPTRTVTKPGTYIVRYYTSPCSYHADTFIVGFPNGLLPEYNISGSCKNSSNGSIELHPIAGDTVNYHYTWRNKNGDTLSVTKTLPKIIAGTYTLHIQTALCDTTLIFLVPELDHHVSFSVDSIVCAGIPVPITNTSDTYFTHFNWESGAGQSSNERAPTFRYELPGYYTIKLTGNGDKCSDSVFKTILVDPAYHNLSFTADRYTLCVGETVQLFPDTDSTITRLYWQFGDGNSLFAKTAPLQHAYTTNGTMQVQLTATFRVCPAIEKMDTISVYPLPLVNLGPDSVLCLHGAAIPLQNHLTQEATDQYQWSTGDTSRIIQARRSGYYSLTVKNEHGCSGSEQVNVSKNCYIDIPNAFTPNGDGYNDYFFPRQLLSPKIVKFRMQVFNRWGQTVFETEKTDGRGWDGQYNSIAQPEGTYLYQIQAYTNSQEPEQYQGNVTLMR